MPRPTSKEDFTVWLVPARNNIQREMLRLRPVLRREPFSGTPDWVFSARHLVLGSCFSLWRSVFQARNELPNKYLDKAGIDFLDKIILDNAATYTTELNGWSLQYYIENSVYRVREAQALALAAGVDESFLPKAEMIDLYSKVTWESWLEGSSTPYKEWEQCLLATRALTTAMKAALAAADAASR